MSNDKRDVIQEIRFSEKYRKIRVFHANRIAYGLGSLNATEQHIFDLLTSKIKKEDIYDTEYHISMTEIVEYLGLGNKGGSFYHAANTNLNKLSKNHLTTYDKRAKRIKLIPLFSKLLYDKSKGTVSYIFSKGMSQYLFNLRNNFYSTDLYTSRCIIHKNVLILFRMWCAKKTYDFTTEISGTMDLWKMVFQGSNVVDHRWTNSSVVYVLKKTLKQLADLFNNRYFFQYDHDKNKYTYASYKIIISGDNSTAFPIINEVGERSNGEEMILRNDEKHNDNLCKLRDIFHANIKSIIYNEVVKMSPEAIEQIAFMTQENNDDKKKG